MQAAFPWSVETIGGHTCAKARRRGCVDVLRGREVAVVVVLVIAFGGGGAETRGTRA